MTIMEKVESMDELLMAILVRLPRKSVFRFKCVSKRWYNILNDPFFSESYTIARSIKLSSNRLLAFIQIKSTVKMRSRISWFPKDFPRPRGQQLLMKIVPLLVAHDHQEVEQVPNKLGYFINSSDGLILCGHYRHGYNVLNPITRTILFSFPPPEDYGYASMGLVREENSSNSSGVFNFRAISAEVTNFPNNTVWIQTYSSSSGEWKDTMLNATEPVSLQAFKHPFVHNGIIHWFTWNNSLAIYDSNEFDNHFQLIGLPTSNNNNEQIYSTSVTRSSSDDVLWFGINKSKCIEFWMLPKDDQGGGYKRATTIPGTEWNLMHKITHESVRLDIIRAQPEKSIKRTRKNCTVSRKSIDDGYIYSSLVHLEWLIPGNPLVAVLRLRGLICLYNLETTTVELVRYEDRHVQDLETTDPYYCSWYPYMPPLSLASPVL